MDNLLTFTSNQSTRCLANNRIKARIIKDTFMREGSIHDASKMAKKVVIFETMLSEQILHQIETKQLKDFEKQMEGYCKKQEKIKSFSPQQETSVNHFLQEIKKSTKIHIHKERKRSKTLNKLNDNFGILTVKQSFKVNFPKNINQSIPLGNMKIQQAIAKGRGNAKHNSIFNLQGKGVNSHLISILQKMEQIDQFDKIRVNADDDMPQEIQNDILGPASLLKYQKERLKTALDNKNRTKFKPLGNKYHKPDYQKLYKSTQNENKQYKKSNKKIIHYKNRNQLTQPSLLSSYNGGKGSIQFQEALPIYIRQSPSYKGLALARQKFKSCIVSKQKAEIDSISQIFNFSRNNVRKVDSKFRKIATNQQK